VCCVARPRRRFLQAEPVEKRQLREREARPKGPGFGRLKEEQRRREGNKIATENQAVLARLQARQTPPVALVPFVERRAVSCVRP
jgi:hypothetical protein